MWSETIHMKQKSILVIPLLAFDILISPSPLWKSNHFLDLLHVQEKLILVYEANTHRNLCRNFRKRITC